MKTIVNDNINEQLIERVIHRLKEQLRLKYDKDLANKMGLSAGDFLNRKKRGTLLDKLLSLSVATGVKVNDIIYGSYPDISQDPIISQVQHLYADDISQPSTHHWKISDAVTMATRVLDSETSYADALYVNIVHFDRALQAEGRIVKMEQQQKDTEAVLSHIQNDLGALKEEFLLLKKENVSLKMSRSSGEKTDCDVIEAPQHVSTRKTSSRKTT